MNKDEYKRYLQSEHWLDVKARFKASGLYTGTCYACGSREKLQIHHKTYQRLGQEKLTDLICLCGECHTKVHQVLTTRESGKTTLFNVAKKLRKQIAKWGKKRALAKW